MGMVDVYCTDADILANAPVDYFNLCPPGQALAGASDGVFAADDLWTLTSASQPFEAAGIGIGNVLYLTGPRTTYKPPGEYLAVAGASGGALTLERRGLLPGVVGKPPGPAGGLSGVVFSVPTFYPQIEAASYAINQEVGIDPYRGIPYGQLYDPRELRDAAVAHVLYMQYHAMSALASDSEDTFLAKSNWWRERYDGLMKRVRVRVQDAAGRETTLKQHRVVR